MTAPNHEIPIHELPKGEIATITSLEGNDCEVARVSALGLRTGVEVCSVRNGGTCIFEYGCSRICLRTTNELKVMVSRES